jgi:hypothetical protein
MSFSPSAAMAAMCATQHKGLQPHLLVAPLSNMLVSAGYHKHPAAVGSAIRQLLPAAGRARPLPPVSPAQLLLADDAGTASSQTCLYAM